MDYYFKILNLLRTNNINSEIYSGSSGFKGQSNMRIKEIVNTLSFVVMMKFRKN